MSNKLNKEEIYVTIECLQFCDEHLLNTVICKKEISGAIFKLQHQLKHLEDLEVKQK